MGVVTRKHQQGRTRVITGGASHQTGFIQETIASTAGASRQTGRYAGMIHISGAYHQNGRHSNEGNPQSVEVMTNHHLGSLQSRTTLDLPPDSRQPASRRMKKYENNGSRPEKETEVMRNRLSQDTVLEGGGRKR